MFTAITVVSIVFPACHVFKSYSVDPFFRWGRRGTRGEVRQRSKSSASDFIKEKMVYNIYIIFY